MDKEKATQMVYDASIKAFEVAIRDFLKENSVTQSALMEKGERSIRGSLMNDPLLSDTTFEEDARVILDNYSQSLSTPEA